MSKELFLMSGEDRAKLLNYLGTQKYVDVFGLVAALYQLQAFKPEEKKAKVEEKPAENKTPQGK